MCRMPSQCSTSGISSWKRTSCTPATHSVRAKYSSARSPPAWRLRALYTRNLVTSPSARPSLRKYASSPRAAVLRAANALLDRVREVRTAGTDGRTENVRAVALIMHARGQWHARVADAAHVAEQIQRLTADRRQEQLDVAARDELRIHARGLLEQRVT